MCLCGSQRTTSGVLFFRWRVFWSLSRKSSWLSSELQRPTCLCLEYTGIASMNFHVCVCLSLPGMHGVASMRYHAWLSMWTLGTEPGHNGQHLTMALSPSPQARYNLSITLKHSNPFHSIVVPATIDFCATRVSEDKRGVGAILLCPPM